MSRDSCTLYRRLMSNMEDHSDDELRDYKAWVADWEKTREMGFVIYILYYGVLLEGAPLTLVGAIVLVDASYPFSFDVKFLHPGILAILAFTALMIGIRSKLDEWKTNEAEYQSWKLYESGGDILGIDD